MFGGVCAEYAVIFGGRSTGNVPFSFVLNGDSIERGLFVFWDCPLRCRRLLIRLGGVVCSRYFSPIVFYLSFWIKGYCLRKIACVI